MTVIVILKTPLDKFSKCESRIRNAIQAGVKNVADREEEIELLGNKIRIHYSLVPRSSDKKVVGIVDNQRASADIYENVRVALEHRLVEKTRSCQSLPHRPLWLALLHDYWLAPESTVARAMKASSVVQPFEKILLVLGSGRVCSIYERAQQEAAPAAPVSGNIRQYS